MKLFLASIASMLIVSCGKFQKSTKLNQEKRMHEDAELKYTPWYLHLASGTPGLVKQKYDWPYKVESIGHTIASYQNYGGSPYFHHGLDIRADADTAVYASAGGKVVNIENYVRGNPAYWEVAIQDVNGFIWQYHHVTQSSIPKAIWDAFRNKGSVKAGTKIGEIYYWPVVTFGERFHHIHLNILGKGGVYLNPFRFLKPLPDKQAPKIVDFGLLKNGRKVNGSKVSAPYSLYTRIDDLIMHKKFIVPPNEISYSVDGRKTHSVWKFDSLPGGKSRTKFVSNLFVKSMVCGDYQCRKPFVDLGFTKQGGQVFTRTAGKHQIEITAKDYAGNKVSKKFSWTVE